jgi:hypothetical protein
VKKYSIYIFSLLLIVNSISFSQTCGFGCLGLSGFYGGYSVQLIEPTGLNEHLTNLARQFSATADQIKFSKTEGFRIGANLFRAQFDKYFLTAKGYYQFLKQDKSINSFNSVSAREFNSTLELNHWGVGLDFGIPLFRFMNWKIIEGGVTFYTTDLSYSTIQQDNSSSEFKYEQVDVNVGYYVGTGVIIHIIEDHISIEGTAAYNQVSIDDLINADSNFLLGENSNRSVLDKGSFSASIQLNIGVPL